MRRSPRPPPSPAKQELGKPLLPGELADRRGGGGSRSRPSPLLHPGKAYLAGPYKGAPLSGVAITPAVAGPFDLGTVVVRAPAYVDPVTAQLSRVSDDSPTSWRASRWQLRDARLSLDRSVHPQPLQLRRDGITGAGGLAAGQLRPALPALPGRRLPRPRLRPQAFSASAAAPGAAPTRNCARCSMPSPAGSQHGRASVALPRSEFLENAHIRTVCTRVQFAAKQCPKGAIYGHA